MNETGKVWVGVFSDGEKVVFDPSRQMPPESELAILWNVAEVRFIPYFKDMARQQLRAVNDPIIRHSVLNQYCAFLDRQIEINHKNRLSELGIRYTGTSKAKAGKVRTTHCYSCKQDLDTAIDKECNNCGWIICKCGACGCGYHE